LRYLLQGPMRPVDLAGIPLEPQSAELPGWARLPPMAGDEEGAPMPPFPGMSWAIWPWAWRLLAGLYPPIWIAIIAAAVLGLMLRWTTFGFRLKVVGQNPEAARVAGMNVPRVAMATLAISGALAGLAGVVSVAGVAPYVLYPDRAGDGVGFTAIAVALLGRLSAAGTVFSALFFALLSTAFKALERSDLAVHSSTAQAVQGALILALLITTSGRWIWKARKPV